MWANHEKDVSEVQARQDDTSDQSGDREKGTKWRDEGLDKTWCSVEYRLGIKGTWDFCLAQLIG